MKKRLYLLVPITLTVLFIIFTIIVKTVDVYYIAANNSNIGLYTINSNVKAWVESLNKMSTMTKLSDGILIFSFVFPLVYLIVGIVQWIKRKSLKLVDPHLFVLAGLYVAMVAIYFIFEIAKVNFAPIFDGKLKPSYPSTHVFFTSCFFFSGIYAAIHLINIEKKYLRAITYALVIFMLLLAGFMRLLSGNHWCTDIFASYILTGMVLSTFIYVYNLFPYQESTVLE